MKRSSHAKNRFICQPALTGGRHSVANCWSDGEESICETNSQTNMPRGLISVAKRDSTNHGISLFRSPAPNTRAEPIKTKARMNEPCRFAHSSTAMGRVHRSFGRPFCQCHNTQSTRAKRGYANICGRIDQFMLLDNPRRIVRNVASFVPVPR